MNEELLALRIMVDADRALGPMERVNQKLHQMGNEADNAEKKLNKLGDKSKWEDLATGINSTLEIAEKLTGLFNKALDMAHFSREMENLKQHVPVERLRMMQEATEGAVGKVDLMKFSMKALSGEFRLTEAGMETLLRAANTLGDKGFGDTKENAEKLLDTLRTGTSRGLAEFGIKLKDTADKQANVNAMMKEFKKLALEDAPVDETLKQIELAQTKFHDFLTDVEAGLGNIVNQLLVAIGKLAGFIPETRQDKIQGRATRAANRGGIPLSNFTAALGQTQVPQLQMYEQMQRDLGIGGAQGGQEVMDFYARQAVALATSVKMDQIEQAYNDAMEEEANKAIAARQKGAQTAGKMPGAPYDKAARGHISDLARNFIAGGSEGLPDKPSLLYQGFDWWNKNTQNPAAYTVSNFSNQLSTFFNEDPEKKKDREKALKDFQKDIGDTTTAMGAGYSVVTSALGAAVDAAISGSETIGKAMQRASAQALKAIALESAAKAVYSTAEAIFTRDPTKLYAAAEYAAAATLAAAGAAALGGGGGTSAGTSRGASPRTMPGGGFGSGGGGGSSGNQTFNIYVGDGFVGRPDELSVAIADKLAHGVQSGRVTNLAQTKPGAVTFRS